MARTFTYTKTRTFTRVDLLKSQVRIALRRTTSISQETLKRLEKGFENRWIEKVRIYALDTQKLIRAELVLEIDWEEHSHQLSIGKATVTIDERWVDDTSIEVDEIVSLFNEFVRSYSLATAWRIVFTGQVNNDPARYHEALQLLGLETAAPLKRAGKMNGVSYPVPEISEFSVGFYYVDEE